MIAVLADCASTCFTTSCLSIILRVDETVLLTMGAAAAPSKETGWELLCCQGSPRSGLYPDLGWRVFLSSCLSICFFHVDENLPLLRSHAGSMSWRKKKVKRKPSKQHGRKKIVCVSRWSPEGVVILLQLVCLVVASPPVSFSSRFCPCVSFASSTPCLLSSGEQFSKNRRSRRSFRVKECE